MSESQLQSPSPQQSAHEPEPVVAPPASSSVSVVIITNRTDEAMLTALKSVVGQEHRPLEIVLFGNGAQVEPPSELRNAPGVSWVLGDSPRNLGVAGGRNAAVALATSPYLLFLDDDGILEPGSVAAALGALRDDGAAAVAFRIVDPDTRRTALWFHPSDPEQHGETAFDVDVILGGANLLRRDAFDQVGGFWEGYFREMEDIDLSWRLLDAGWRIRFEPAAVMLHQERHRRIYRYAVPSNVAMLWRLLPARLALRQTLVKLPLFALRAVRHREVGEFLAGLRATPRTVRRALRERAALSDSTVADLRRLHGSKGFGRRLQWSLRRDS